MLPARKSCTQTDTDIYVHERPSIKAMQAGQTLLFSVCQFDWLIWRHKWTGWMIRPSTREITAQHMELCQQWRRSRAIMACEPVCLTSCTLSVFYLSESLFVSLNFDFSIKKSIHRTYAMFFLIWYGPICAILSAVYCLAISRTV